MPPSGSPPSPSTTPRPSTSSRSRGAPLSHSTWDVETAHFAERFQLFMIIALGETIVLTGATTSELDLDPARVTAFALAFLATAALWWLYFGYVAQHRGTPPGARTRADAPRPGRLSRTSTPRSLRGSS